MVDSKYMVISYVPLLKVEPGSDIEESIHVLPSINVHACIWIIRDNVPIPIFVIEKADEVYNHLMWWTEEHPGEWFSFATRFRSPKSYVLALVPNLKKSYERWKIAFQLKFGYPPDSSIKEKYIFKPIYFCSGSGENYVKLYGEDPPSQITIGFMDNDKLIEKISNGIEPQDLKFDDVNFIGPIPIIRELFDRYLDEILDEMKK
jgi:hypothetical protein